MSTKAERLAVVSKVIAAVNSGKDSDIDGAFAQDFKLIVPGTGGRESNDMPMPPGIDGKCASSSFLTSGPKAVIGALHKAFSDFKFYPLKSIPEDDGGENIVASRIEFTGLLPSKLLADRIGVHTGEFLDVPPTGKSIVGRFIAFDKIEGNKLVSSEVFMDVAGLLIQFGVMPPPKGF